MNITLTPVSLVRVLKGAPISCLITLQLARKPVQAGWLCQATGYSAHVVTDALRWLEDLGLAEHDGHRSAWQATMAGFPGLDTPVPSDPADDSLTSDGTRSDTQRTPESEQIANRDPGPAEEELSLNTVRGV